AGALAAPGLGAGWARVVRSRGDERARRPVDHGRRRRLQRPRAAEDGTRRGARRHADQVPRVARARRARVDGTLGIPSRQGRLEAARRSPLLPLLTGAILCVPPTARDASASIPCWIPVGSLRGRRTPAALSGFDSA